MSGIAHAISAPHGTRGRYVSGCRCADCKRSNVEYYHRRQAEKRELAGEVRPSGPAGEGVLLRGGVRHKVKTCPGANGKPCVRAPAAWLRKGDVCSVCVERETVWNGNVPVDEARAHLLKLRRVNVGYKSAHEASDVARNTVAKVLRGDGAIRAKTLKRLLEVDAGARADHALAPKRSFARMMRVLEKLRAMGFRKGHLAQLLGAKRAALQVGRTGGALVATVAAVDKLWRKVERGELRPPPPKSSRALAERHHDREEVVRFARGKEGWAALGRLSGLKVAPSPPPSGSRGRRTSAGSPGPAKPGPEGGR